MMEEQIVYFFNIAAAAKWKKPFHMHLVEYKLFPFDVKLLYPFIIPLY